MTQFRKYLEFHPKYYILVLLNKKGAFSLHGTSNDFVKELSKQSREFCIIGLTGKVRSGTSDVCKLLTSDNFPDYMALPDTNYEDLNEDAREYRIIYDYIQKNWKPFIELNVSGVIASFLLEVDTKSLQDVKHGGKIYAVINELAGDECKNQELFWANVRDKVIKTITNLFYTSQYRYSSKQYKPLQTEIRIFEEVISQHQSNQDSFFKQWEAVKIFLEDSQNRPNGSLESIQNKYRNAVIFCFGILPAIDEKLKHELNKDDQYPIVFQKIGNGIRATGNALSGLAKGNIKIHSNNLFALPKRINQFIKVLRNYTLYNVQAQQPEKSPVYIVINNFKNIFETYYFKRRYSAFYLLSVTCDEVMRRDQFEKRSTYLLTNLREDLSNGKKIYKRAIRAKCYDPKRFAQTMDNNQKQKIKEELKKELDSTDAELDFMMDLLCSENNLFQKAYKDNLAPFILQDIMTCIENADIFAMRNYKESNCQYDQNLIRLIGRVITLILHPGLLTPTRLERCMQIAMTAKLNSGCLSRQVGAVVTDKHYNILSLGWNDAPCGAESCMRRNFFDLIRKDDKCAYSDYELNDEQFRNYISTVSKELNPNKTDLGGLPMAFCFKDVYQDIIKQRDQIYTRALHAEERALAACGNEKAAGGYLFTTSSPCELCAKRAKEANVSKIYYIQQYPGISRTHIIHIGPKEKRSTYVSFVGAVGLAYVKLYTPLIPYKDELAALGFSPTDLYKKHSRSHHSANSQTETSRSVSERNLSSGQLATDGQPSQPTQPNL